MKPLLVCIAFHYVPDRLKWLKQVVDNFITTYPIDMDISIATNIIDTKKIIDYIGDYPNVYIHSYSNMGHLFYLTRMHRQIIKTRIESYDMFMYIEDDELLPFENYLAATKKYDFMWPDYVPTFIRIEESEGKQFISDVTKQLKLTDQDIVELHGRFFTTLPFPNNYNGFWMMPQKYLKDNMRSDFTKMTDAREWSAMYPSWELGKKGLIEIYQQGGRWQIHPNNFSWHLPNNYIGSPMGNATIEVKNVFI